MSPLHDFVLVKPDKAEDRSKGGIIIPDVARDKPESGTVIEVGPGRRNEDGTRQPLDVAVGDRVLFSRYGGHELKLDDVEHQLIRETDVLGVLDAPKGKAVGFTA